MSGKCQFTRNLSTSVPNGILKRKKKKKKKRQVIVAARTAL